MEEVQYLTRIGLSEQEAAIYLLLLNSEALTLSDMSKKSGIHRPALYRVLPKLENKEIITKMKIGKREYYSAESPKKIAKLFNKIQSGFNLFIERLSDQYDSSSIKPSVQYLVGKKGYDFLFDDIASSIPKNGIYYRYSSRKLDEKYFIPTEYYKKERDRKKFERKVITSVKKSNIKSKRLEREIKVIPENFDLFDDNVSSFIYENKVAFTDFDNQITFIVSSKKIAEFQKKLFELLWKKL
ncbi:MAG: HTH-type transcriptional regulator, sugar sensing transcriptional regulator [Patescibacteria group bacterium]|nr:HTH-type transcriptional regulator, sugar sensing transcriptional regulator [Patescibacteria group bacterium]